MWLVRALLDAKANVNQANEYGQTPVHIAAKEGHTEFLQALIDAKAHIEAKNNIIKTWKILLSNA